MTEKRYECEMELCDKSYKTQAWLINHLYDHLRHMKFIENSYRRKVYSQIVNLRHIKTRFNMALLKKMGEVNKMYEEATEPFRFVFPKLLRELEKEDDTG